MEYRSLFDTDTDTLLNEISSLEQQQQQQQQQNMYINTQPQQPNYSSQGLHAANQFASANLYASPQPQLMHQHQFSSQQQQQQPHHGNAPNYANSAQQQQQQQQQYYGNALAGSSNIKTNYMHSPMAPPPPPQPPPQQQQVLVVAPNGGIGASSVNTFSMGKSMQQQGKKRKLNEYRPLFSLIGAQKCCCLCKPHTV